MRPGEGEIESVRKRDYLEVIERVDFNGTATKNVPDLTVDVLPERLSVFIYYCVFYFLFTYTQSRVHF